MSEENVAAVRAVYERWGAGDFRAGLDLFDPEVVFVMHPGFPDAGIYNGVAGIGDYTRGFLEAWGRIAIEAEDITDAGNDVLAAVRQHGVGTGSGAVTDLRYFQVWSFRGRKVVRLENFRERGDARAAAGSSG
jgi:ketosteroid isomerase-like protein